MKSKIQMNIQLIYKMTLKIQLEFWKMIQLFKNLKKHKFLWEPFILEVEFKYLKETNLNKLKIE